MMSQEEINNWYSKVKNEVENLERDYKNRLQAEEELRKHIQEKYKFTVTVSQAVSAGIGNRLRDKRKTQAILAKILGYPF